MRQIIAALIIQWNVIMLPNDSPKAADGHCLDRVRMIQ